MILSSLPEVWVYMHVIPGMDEEGAQLAAAAILGKAVPPVTAREASPLL